MTRVIHDMVHLRRLPPRLRPGDRVRLVSPASRPDPAQVQRGASILSEWGLHVEIAAHAFDCWGHYLAGRDEDRLADLDEAFRDPGVRAVFSTTGGKGSYRIADRLDFAAISRDPKPFVGFSDLTAVHLARWQRCGVPGFHGPHMAWNDDYYGAVAAERLRAGLMDAQSVVVRQDPREPTAAVTTSGVATGILMGGTLGVISSAVGWGCPPFAGMINDLLDVSQIDARRLALERAETDLAALLDDAVERLDDLVPGHPVRLQVRVRPAPVLIDAARVKQVLGHLVSNDAKIRRAGRRDHD